MRVFEIRYNDGTLLNRIEFLPNATNYDIWNYCNKLIDEHNKGIGNADGEEPIS